MIFNIKTSSFKMDLAENSPHTCNVGAFRISRKSEQDPPI